MQNIPDMYDMYMKHEREEALYEASLPRCAECDRPIMDDMAWEYNDEPVCDECMRKNHHHPVEHWME